MKSRAYTQTAERIEKCENVIDALSNQFADNATASIAFSLVNARLLVEIADMLNALCEAENVSERLRSE